MNELDSFYETLVAKEVERRLQRKQRRAEKMGQKLARDIKPVPPRAKLLERFWSYTKIAPSGCIEWIGGRMYFGHGAFAFARETLAHRVAWLLQKGEIPNGLYVCHRCNNPPCVNVDHLYIGTQQDNMDDARKIGKTQFMTRHRYTVTSSAAREIRDLYTACKNAGRKRIPRGLVPILMERYGLGKSTISHLGAGRFLESTLDPRS